jgi:hypothetical protein
MPGSPVPDAASQTPDHGPAEPHGAGTGTPRTETNGAPVGGIH